MSASQRINFRVGIGLRKIVPRERISSQSRDYQIAQSFSNPMIKRGFMPLTTAQRYKYSIEEPHCPSHKLTSIDGKRIKSLSNSQDISTFQVLLPKLQPTKHLKFKYNITHSKRTKEHNQRIVPAESADIKPKKFMPKPIPLNKMNFKSLIQQLKDKRQFEDREHTQSGHNSVYYEDLKTYYEKKYRQENDSPDS